MIYFIINIVVCTYRDEKKKYRKLQKEVEKMSTMMLDEGDEEDEDGVEKGEKEDQPAVDDETESEEESGKIAMIQNCSTTIFFKQISTLFFFFYL